MNKSLSRRLRSRIVWPLVSASTDAIRLLLQQLNAKKENPSVVAVREMVRGMNEIAGMVQVHGFPDCTTDDLALDLEAQLHKRGFNPTIVENPNRPEKRR